MLERLEKSIVEKSMLERLRSLKSKVGRSSRLRSYVGVEVVVVVVVVGMSM